MNIENLRPVSGGGQKIYIETYGCQMNVGDTEIVVSIMQKEGYSYTEDIAQADVILINTCSVRDNAEQRIWGRLKEFKRYKKEKKSLLVGVIGCMAERLKEQLMEKEQIVDIVAGPDSYRELPSLVKSAFDGARGVNVLLSREETYAEISPVRLDKNGVSAFIAIMRGCNNMCSYCVVPFTRGRERSRDPHTIVKEARDLFDAGYREVTLLGQNVNSFSWDAELYDRSIASRKETSVTDPVNEKEIFSGSTDVTRNPDENTNHLNIKSTQNPHHIGFPELLKMVAQISPLLRVRFATSHPKDISDDLLKVISSMPNICRCIHLPAQSGSSRMLDKMNRRYTREWYMERISAIKKYLPDCSVTTDLIAGFCGETEADHSETLTLMREVDYDFAYMFKYSERPDTKAAKTMADDVPEQVKTRRLNEIIALQNEISLKNNRKDIGKKFEVLVEGISKKSDKQLFGRTSQNKVVVFDREDAKTGDYVITEITDCSSATLFGRICK